MLNYENLRPVKRGKQVVAYENSVAITATVFALFRMERDIIDSYGADYTDVFVMKDVAASSIQACFDPPALDFGMIQAPFSFQEISTGGELDFFMPTIDRMDEVVSAYMWFHGLDGVDDANEENDPFLDEGGMNVSGLHRFLPLLRADTGPPIFFPENLYQFLDYLRKDRGRVRFANLFARAPLSSLVPSPIDKVHAE